MKNGEPCHLSPSLYIPGSQGSLPYGQNTMPCAWNTIWGVRNTIPRVARSIASSLNCEGRSDVYSSAHNMHLKQSDIYLSYIQSGHTELFVRKSIKLITSIWKTIVAFLIFVTDIKLTFQNNRNGGSVALLCKMHIQ